MAKGEQTNLLSQKEDTHKSSLLFGRNKIKVKIHLPEVKLAVSRREEKNRKKKCKKSDV